MNFVVIGTSHSYSPIKLREKMVFSKKRMQDILGFLKETRVLEGGVILSTCNRVEIYASMVQAESGIAKIKDFLLRFYEFNEKDLIPHLYIYRHSDAVRHLFRVASGLDSLILGETQILNQVKESFYESEKSGFVGYLINEIFCSAISTAKKIHASTKISEGKVSIGSVAVDFIKQRIGALSGKNILIIGVGKVTELVLKYLKKESNSVVFISNRTFKKAQAFAHQIGAKAVRFDNLKDYIRKADILITATKSPHSIIKKETFGYQPSGINQNQLLIMDLALPRDVDPEVKEIDGVELFGMEDLGTVIQRNRDKKMIEAEKAEQVIELEAERLWQGVLESEREKALLH